MPDGVFVPREGGVRFEPLPAPTQAEVERLLRMVRHRVLRLLEKRGALPAQGPEDALQTYQAHCLQQRLRWTEVDVRLPPRKQPRCAFLEGFSLHANMMEPGQWQTRITPPALRIAIHRNRVFEEARFRRVSEKAAKPPCQQVAGIWTQRFRATEPAKRIS